MKDHREMTIDVMKNLPYLLNDPIIVLDSKTVPGRLVLLGEIYANEKPVMMALEINLSTRSGKSNYVDVIKIASTYTRNNNQNIINTSNIRYINKNKSRVNEWLKVNRLQLPLPNSQSDSAINSISEKSENVNQNSKNSEKSIDMLISNYRYKKMNDATKALTIKTVYDYYCDCEKSKITGQATSKVVLIGKAVSIDKFALVKSYTSSVKAISTQSRKTLILQYMNSMGLSFAQKYIILASLGYKVSEYERTLKTYINRIDLTKTEKQELLEVCVL